MKKKALSLLLVSLSPLLASGDKVRGELGQGQGQNPPPFQP